MLSFQDDSGLSCRLDTHPMDNAPSYIALSYTWGTVHEPMGRQSSLTYSITINGEKIDIQQNLHDALRYLVKHVRSRQCLLWIDAICINQKNDLEKNAQVRKMKDIYENAHCVYAWLGLPHDEEEIRLAIRMMGDFNRYLANGLAEIEDDIHLVLPTITDRHPAFPIDENTETWKAWNGIAKMFTRSYWQRAWIYQEASTPGEIWFFCGDHKFDDIYLSATISFGLTFSNIPEFDHQSVDAVGHAVMLLK